MRWMISLSLHFVKFNRIVIRVKDSLLSVMDIHISSMAVAYHSPWALRDLAARAPAGPACP
jgi:hypothetical protein